MPQEITHRTGVLYAISAFSFWGMVPIYFKQVADVSPLEVLAHRILWSMVLLLIFLIASRRFGLVGSIFRDPKQRKMLLLSSLLVSANWLIFIYAVGHSMILETSLGYFINPLISIFLGYLFFGERMGRRQWIGVGLVFVAVLIQLVVVGSLPIISLGIALTFAFYGVVRKYAHVPSIPGLFIETLMVLPLAIGYLIYLYMTSSLSFGSSDAYTNVMLSLAGFITVLPLLWFNAATIRIPLTLIGILQYIGSSLAFLIAILIYHETLDTIMLLTFVLVWIAIIIFSWQSSKIRETKRKG
jgi:chloramphenicol-sensitive protein RarD